MAAPSGETTVDAPSNAEAAPPPAAEPAEAPAPSPDFGSCSEGEAPKEVRAEPASVEPRVPRKGTKAADVPVPRSDEDTREARRKQKKMQVKAEKKERKGQKRRSSEELEPQATLLSPERP